MKNLLSKLQSETFVLDIKATGAVPKLSDYTMNMIDPQTLELKIERNQGINAAFEQLTEQGVQVLSMRNKSNRLEELFVKLTHEEEVKNA